MTNSLKLLSALSNNSSDKEDLLNAANSLSRATVSYLESLQPVITGQAGTDQMYINSRNVSITASNLLALIGYLDVNDDLQKDLIEAARSVARATAEIVGNAKRIADTLDNDQQLDLADDAQAIASFANVIVATT
jgi:hypothetical protein